MKPVEPCWCQADKLSGADRVWSISLGTCVSIIPLHYTHLAILIKVTTMCVNEERIIQFSLSNTAY